MFNLVTKVYFSLELLISKRLLPLKQHFVSQSSARISRICQAWKSEPCNLNWAIFPYQCCSRGGMCFNFGKSKNSKKKYILVFTLVFLLREHARRENFWLFSSMLALITTCSKRKFSTFFQPAHLIHPARIGHDK